jgi:hypothetical protein
MGYSSGLTFPSFFVFFFCLALLDGCFELRHESFDIYTTLLGRRAAVRPFSILFIFLFAVGGMFRVVICTSPLYVTFSILLIH